MARIGISLEAASWRGAFIAGVLQSFLRRGIRPDLVAGSSSGACNGAGFIAGRPDLLEENWIGLASMPLVDFRRESRTANGGSIFNMSRIFSRALDRGLAPGVARTITGSSMEFLVVCTRLVGDDWHTGAWTEGALLRYPLSRRLARVRGRDLPLPPLEGVVFSSREPEMRENLREVLYASGRIPVLYPVRARINGTHYVDGGFVDKNPVMSLFERGCDRVLALVSNPQGIVRESFFNEGESEAVREVRRSGRLVVLRPSRELGLSKYSWSVSKVTRAVRWGNEAGDAFLKEHGKDFFGS